MTIAEVSKKYNLTPDTIRYYEKEGLIPKIPRNKNGSREFDEKSCRWIEFIKCMRNAGMPVEVLSKYVKLMEKGHDTVKERRQLLINQKEVLLKKQVDINNTLDRITKKIEIYDDIVAGKRKDFMEEP